jgi:hypothetical protein
MVRIIIIGLFLIAFANIYVTHSTPFDGTIWKDTPSLLRITTEIPATNIESNEKEDILVGDLVMEINGVKTNLFLDVESATQLLGAEDLVSLKTFRPTTEHTYSWQVERIQIPTEFLTLLSPSIYIQTPLPSSGSNVSPLQKGDIVLSINEQEFANRLTKDLPGIIHFSIESLLYQPSLKTEQADRLLLGQPADGAISIDLLRQNQTEQVNAPLTQFNLGRAFQFLISTSFEGGIGALRKLDSRSLIPLQIGLGLILMFIGAIQLRTPSGQWGSVAVLTLGCLLLTFGLRKGVAPSGFAWIDSLNWVGLVLLGILFILFIFFYSSRNLDLQKPSIRRAIAFALLVLLPWWFVYHWFKIAPPDASVDYFSLEGICKNLFASGIIPVSILWVFLFGLDYLLQIHHMNAHVLNPLEPINQKIITAVNSGQRDSLSMIFTLQRTYGIFGYYGERIKQLIDRYDRDPDLSAILAMRDDILRQDEEDFALAFIAVSWSEKALPLLGFLGTVLGIRVAVSGIARSINILAGGGTLKDISDDLNAGFEGIGLAFDTTFYALAGLLVLGILHTIIKKGLASQLNYARGILDKVIYMLATRSVVGELATVALEIKSVSGGIHTVVQGTESSANEMKSIARSTHRTYTQMQASVAELHKASQFRKTVQNLVEQIVIEHPDSGFEKIRNIILKPLVEFQRVGEAPAKVRRAVITEQLKPDKWRIACIGVTHTSKYNGVLALRPENKNDLLFPFGIQGEAEPSFLPTQYRFTALYPAQNSETIIGVAESSGKNYDVVHVNLEQKKIRSISSILLSIDDRIFFATFSQGDAALIVQNIDARLMLYGIWVHSGQPTSKQAMLQSCTWLKWDVHTPSGTLFVVGQSNKDKTWQLQYIPVQAQKTQNSEENEGNEDEQDSHLEANNTEQPADLFFDLSHNVRFPEDIIPQEIVAFGEKQILILDVKGILYLWDLNDLAPRKLAHPHWGVSANDCVIRVGADGWIAVISRDQLRMWCVRLGRFLSPYEPEQSYHIVDKIKKSLAVTPDGRYLLAIANDQTIATWEFPRYAVDVA